MKVHPHKFRRTLETRAIDKGMPIDQIYNFISDYVDGSISREQFWVMAKFKYPTHQINFCTEEAIKCLKFRDCQEVIK